MTRDSRLWWVLIVGSMLTAIATNTSMIDPLIPAASLDQAHAVINLLSLIVGIVAGKLATSPLDISEKGGQDEQRAQITDALNKLPVLLLAIALVASAACASTGKILVEADRGIHATVTGLDDIGNAACDAKLRSVADCQAFNAALVTAYRAYETWNRGVLDGSPAGAPAMLDALVHLQAAATSVAPQASALLGDLQRLADHVRALIRR